MDNTKFIQAIFNRRKILVYFHSPEDGTIISRMCAPLDYGPTKRGKNQGDHFHLWDYESKKANRTLYLLPEEIDKMLFTDMIFQPSEFVNWTTSWIIPRSWGRYS